MNSYVNEQELMKRREELKAHCHKLIDTISRHRYCIKLLLAAARGLEMVADYKANRNNKYVEKFPMTLEEAEKLEAINN